MSLRQVFTDRDSFISLINTTSESLKARKVLIFHYFGFYEQLQLHAQIITLEPGGSLK